MANKKTLDQLSVAASQRVKEKEYWLQKLSGFPQKSRFPSDYNKKNAAQYRLDAVSFELSPQLSTALIKLSAGSDVRLHILLVAGISALLHRYLGAYDFRETDANRKTGEQGDIVIGCPILRSDEEADFINTLLALRTQVQSQMTFKELLLEVRQTVAGALENCNYPVEILAEQLDVPFSPGDGFPLFAIAVLVENIHDKKVLEGVHLDMIFSFKRGGLSIGGRVEYNPSLYDGAAVERIAVHLQRLLENASANPEESIFALELMSPAEKEQLLITFNDTGTDYPVDKTIHELFAGQVEMTPDSVGLVGDVRHVRPVRQVSLTYRQLDEQSDRLARSLVEKGVLADNIVGIMMERSIDLIVGILGILKTGGAYLPINPAYPEERIDYMLKDSAVKIMIGRAEERKSGRAEFVFSCFFLASSPPRFLASDSSNFAYIIYTSGSTGQPKGVPITHANLSPLLHWGYRELGITPHDRTVQNLSYFFDWSVWEIFITLTSGAGLYMVSGEVVPDAERYLDFIYRHAITVLHITPTHFQSMLHVSPRQRLKSLRYLCIGAEKLTCDLVERSYTWIHEDCRVFNMYGPTEATIMAAVLEIHKPGLSFYRELSSVPIGKTLGNNFLSILDRHLHPCPLTLPGELYIGGDGVALGYLNNPELTAEKFINKSFAGVKGGLFQKPPLVAYKTGDLCRWLPGGNIEFLGRIDHQVKIRGFRIELGEIENRLLSHPKVREVVVVTRESKGGEDKYLCAYIVPAALHPVETLETAELRDYLAAELPDYMVPTYFVMLEKMPLNPNGKVDRKALPEPARTGAGYIAPRDEVEEKLAQIWAEVLSLGKSAIGIDDDFFELGGHSLKATTLVYRIYKELQVNLEIEKVFTHPTIRELAQQLRNLEEKEYVEIEAVEEEEYYTLSYAQRRLWVLCQFEEDSTAYNIPGAAMVSGPFKVEAFANALQALVDRHESLRTVFISVNGDPRQKVLRYLECRLEQVDLCHLDDGAKEEKAREIYREHSNRAFDLENGPLSRFKSVRLAEEKYLVIFNIHHIVSDGWSQGVIYNDVARFYNAFLGNNKNPLPPLPLQYKDYTRWHKRLIETDSFSESRSYWLEKFKDKPNGIELPLDHSRKPIQTFNGGRVAFNLDKGKTAQLHRLVLEQDATLFMGLLTLVNIFLYRYSGQRDIIIGSPIANRKRPELHHMVGFLVNTLVYRAPVDPGKSFRQLLAETKQETLACFRYQDYPFDLLVEQLGLDRDLSQSPLFNVMLAHNNAETEDAGLKMEGVTISQYSHSGDFNMSKFDLTFFMDENADGIFTRLEYNSDLFERSSIERMAANFLTLADHVLMDGDIPASRLKYIADAEYEKVVRQFNQTEYPFSPLTLQELFEHRVEISRDKTAVVHDRRGEIEKISYDDLNKRANRLALYLRNKYRVKPNHIIAVSLERSIDMIVVLWGIIKAGAAYLAVDPTYPRHRVLHVLGDSRTDLLIIDEIRPQLFDNYKGEILNINDLREEIQAQSPENPGVVNTPSDILYVNYTSGSTGVPNGAMLSHDCLTNLIRWQNEKTTIDCSLRCLQFTSINFCVSFQEIMGTLTSGGELYLIGEVERQDIDYLMAFLVKHRIEILFLPFSYLNFLFNESGRWTQAFNHSLKHIITAGEQLKITAGLKRFLDLNPGLRLHNHYGSTEMHVVTSYTLDAATAGRTPVPPAGKPIGNVKIYILDEYYNPVPIGVYGELFVSGSSEVLGYIDNEELNSKKLYYHPELSESEGNGNKRLYRSGDIGRWMEDGNIELRGRKDFQVKIRGFRIEPGEIESKILAIENIRECVAVVKEDAGRQKYLVAYVSVDNIDISEIKKRISRDLPQYMIPQLVVLDSLPLMHNGKVDRERLPEPGPELGGTYTAPRDEVEDALTGIWAEILNIPKHSVGIDANFFELGGHSLKATLMMSQIHKRLHKKIPLAEIFKAPTIRELAQQLRGLEELEYAEIENVEEKEYYELSYAQRRLWVLCQFEADSTAYNMPGALIVSGPFRVEAFAKAIQALVDRHESFRTVFVSLDGEPRQKIVRDVTCRMEQIDLRHMDGEKVEGKARDIYIEYANRPFDLVNGPLFRFKLAQLEEEKYVLMFTIHHIINDGWSQGIIYNEVARFYNAFLENRENPLPPLKLQYKDYTRWHNRLIEADSFVESQAYWLEKFKDKPNGVELPLDHSRKPIQTFNGGRVAFTLDKETTAQLYRLNQEEDATLFMSLLTLVNIFLYRYSGQKDIIIGSPIANRQRPELHHLVGFLVNTLVYRDRVDPDKSFRQLLAETKQEALACYRFQDYPFDLLVEQLGLDRDLSQSPLFNVMLAHNNAETEDANLAMTGVTISQYSHSDDFNMSKFDLIFFMDEIAGEVHTRIEYNSDLFDRGSIDRMAANFLSLVGHVLMDVDIPASRLKYIAETEYEKVVRQFNDTGAPFSPLTLQELFERRVEICRDKTSVVHEHHGKIEKISYCDLNKRANRLAHYLVSKYAVKANHIIAVSLERSINMIVVLWGIIKAGAAYLAVDPTYPRDRVLHILGDSRSNLLIIDEMRPQLFDNYKGEILNINDLREEIQAQSPENPGIVNTSSDILYVNYTSGSTGVPNGAMLSHDCLTNLIRWQDEMTSIDCSLRCLQFTSINFCVSFQEIMGTLTSGGELYLIGEVERQDIDYLMDFLVRHRIEILFLPFSYLNFLFNESGRWTQAFNHSLKHIITAGEQLKITAGLKRFLDLNPGLRLHNHYGSTEMHVVTSYTLDAATAGRMPVPPAGKPIGNVKIYILDEYYNPVAIGVYGELFVCGSSEVLGYIDNEELNNKKLYYHPELSASESNGNKRLYRSGDIGRWMEDGNIELRGRKDFQVKIRGFRIEPGEIESKILAIENIRECVVVVKEDAARQKYLAAYVSLDNIDIAEIKKRISRDLPQYMIPRLVALDSLPLMHNGKVDRERLPEPDLEVEGVYTAPRDEVEGALAGIWAEILNLPEHSVGIDANFFELGGHSLKAVGMINKIYKTLGVSVPLLDVFQNPTIADIAQVIKNSKVTGFRNIEKQPEKEYYELSYSQKRLWYICKTEPDNPVFNMPGGTTLYEAFDEAVVRRVLERLTARHESLRTFFTEKDKEPVQVIEPTDRLKLNLEVIDLSDLSGPEREQRRRELYMGESLYIFNLRQPPLFRVKLIKCTAEEYDLVFNMHHIISDGWSMEILKQEFRQLLEGYKNGVEPPLEPLELQYKDYAAWQNRLLADDAQVGQAQEFWRGQLSGNLPVLNLPYDFSRPSVVGSKESAAYRIVIPGDLANRLRSMAEERQASLFMVLLAGFNLLLAKVAGQEEIIIAIPAAARQHEALKNIIGMFVNTLILRSRIEPAEPFADFFNRLKDNTLKVLEYQAIPLESICGQLKIKYPEVFVFFNMVNIGSTQQENVKNLDSYHTEKVQNTKFDIVCYLTEYKNGIEINCHYYKNRFLPGTIETLIELYQEMLADIPGDPSRNIGEYFLGGKKRKLKRSGNR